MPSPSSGDDHDASLPSVHEFQPPLLPPALPPVDAEDSGNRGSISGESDPPSPVVMEEWHDGSPEAAAPISENGVGGHGNGRAGAPNDPTTDDGGVRWCAVRDEVKECRSFVGVINQLTGNVWKW